MIQFSKSFLLATGLVATVAGATLLAGCSGTAEPGQGSFFNGIITQNVSAAAVVFTQVEQLSRPAIGEGVFTNNDDLNAYNSVLAFQEPGALVANGQLTALAGDAAATLTAFATVGGDATATEAFANDPTAPTRVVEEITALIPDVIRIDTVNGVAPQDPGTNVYTTGYTSAAVAVGQSHAQRSSVIQQVVMPTGGRKFEDDVIDITLNQLSNGFTSGGVAIGQSTDNTIASFKAGNNASVTETITGGAFPGDGADYSSDSKNDGIDPLGNPAQGHHLLRGQTLPYGQCVITGFPYAPDPN